MASSQSSRLLGILTVCLAVLLVIIILIVTSAGDRFFVNAITGTIFSAFQVEPGTFGGWIVLLIVGGIVLISAMGTFSLMKYAIGLFRM